MRKPLDLVIAGLFAAIVILTAYVWVSPEGIRAAPDIELTTLKGKKFNPARAGNKPVLVTFWSTTCATCIEEMPHLTEIYHDYHKAGFKLISVSMFYDPPNDVFNMVKHRKLPYPVVVDLQKDTMRAFGMKRPLTPTTYLISPNGRIVFQKIGKLRINRLRRKIEAMLARSSDARH